MADWKEILNNSEDAMSEEELLRQLNNHFAGKHELPVDQLIQDDFEKDALEGLQQLNDTATVNKNVKQLKQRLRQQLNTKSSRSKLKSIGNQQWFIYALLLILFICIIGYVLVKLNSSIP